MKVLSGIWAWLKGKKTIFGGLVILAGAVAGVWYGRLDPVTGLTVAGVGFSVIGWADKANRHQAELLTAFQGIAKVGADVRTGNSQQAVQDAETTVTGLAPAVMSEGISLGGASLHISGNTADEVASLAKSLLAPTVTVNPTSAPITANAVRQAITDVFSAGAASK